MLFLSLLKTAAKARLWGTTCYWQAELSVVVCVAAQSGAAGSSCWLSGGVRTQEVCLLLVCMYVSASCADELEARQGSYGLLQR